MLKWLEKPNAQFNEYLSHVFTNAIIAMEGALNDVSVSSENVYTDLIEAHSKETIIDVTKEIKIAHESDNLFRLSEYHNIFIDAIVERYGDGLVAFPSFSDDVSANDVKETYADTCENKSLSFWDYKNNRMLYDFSHDYITGVMCWVDDLNDDPLLEECVYEYTSDEVWQDNDMRILQTHELECAIDSTLNLIVLRPKEVKAERMSIDSIIDMYGLYPEEPYLFGTTDYHSIEECIDEMISDGMHRIVET